MFDYIDKLRKKTEPEKRRFAIGVSFVLVIIIAVFWTVALVVKVKNGDFIGVPTDSTEVSENTPTLKETWQGFVSDIKNIVNRPIE